jgi:TonB family protein
MNAMKCLVVLILLVLIIEITAVTSRRVPQAQNAPTLISATFPVYPPIAKAAQVRGDIKVRVRIDASGDVTNSEILEGHKLLNDYSITAARQWKFEKQSIQDKRYAELTFRYSLMPRCSDKRSQTPIFHAPLTVEVREEKPWIICDDCGPDREREINCKNP